MPRMCGAIFGANVAELIVTQPPPPIDDSPQAARLAGYRKQAGEGSSGPMPRPDGGANLFGSGEGTTHNHPGCRAGAFGSLVPTCEPRATVKQTIERMEVADLRTWAAVRADTGHAFDLMSEQSLALGHGSAGRGGAPSTAEGHLVAFGGTLEDQTAVTLGLKQIGSPAAPFQTHRPFDRHTGTGYVAARDGEHLGSGLSLSYRV